MKINKLKHGFLILVILFFTGCREQTEVLPKASEEDANFKQLVSDYNLKIINSSNKRMAVDSNIARMDANTNYASFKTIEEARNFLASLNNQSNKEVIGTFTPIKGTFSFETEADILASGVPHIFDPADPPDDQGGGGPVNHTGRITFKRSPWYDMVFLINYTITSNGVVSVTNVTSKMSGSTLGAGWSQTTYEANVVGKEIRFTVYGTESWSLFVDGIGTFYEDDVRYTGGLDPTKGAHFLKYINE